MQPTEVQVQRSLAALRSPGIESDALDDGRELSLAELPDGLLERITSAPEVRAERLEHARHWVEDGEPLDADVLASRMVGRFVCDRLR